MINQARLSFVRIRQAGEPARHSVPAPRMKSAWLRPGTLSRPSPCLNILPARHVTVSIGPPGRSHADSLSSRSVRGVDLSCTWTTVREADANSNCCAAQWTALRNSRISLSFRMPMNTGTLTGTIHFMHSARFERANCIPQVQRRSLDSVVRKKFTTHIGPDLVTLIP